MSVDKYAAAESYHSLAWAYAHVPDLHIMWLLHLCDAHQEMQSWAEAAQCAVGVAGVIMQVRVWTVKDLVVFQNPPVFFITSLIRNNIIFVLFHSTSRCLTTKTVYH